MVGWYAIRCLWFTGMQFVFMVGWYIFGVYGLLVSIWCLWFVGIHFSVYGLLTNICFSRHAGIPLMFMVY